MCITDRHDMTLAVKVVLNPNTTNQQTILQKIAMKNIWYGKYLTKMSHNKGQYLWLNMENNQI